jgi:tetratricopeptide (TPR) repeat protein
MLLGDEEGAWKAAAQMRADAGGRPGRARELDFVNFDLLTWNLMRALDAVAVDASANGGTTQFASEVIIADFQIRLHDPQAAELVIKTVKEDPHDPNIAAMLHFVRGQIAVETGDVAKAAAEMEAFGLGFADPAVSSNEPGYNCWIAPAEEAAGYPAKADAVLKAGGSFVDCYRFRADILDSRRDWPGAQQAYGAALALAPDLPAAYYSYGIALARHGELGAASEKFKQAHERGPHWADPLKAWGDLLLQQGHTAQALAMYDEAIAYAPNWEALKRARERAAQQKS